jgi:hypothetical protein
MTGYTPAFYLAWVNAAVGVIAGALSAAYLLAHPAWLTGDIAATCGVIVTITVGLAALLPQISRSPSAREAKYLAALAGSLPDDIANKHGLTVTQTASGTLNVSSPEKPLDTL